MKKLLVALSLTTVAALSTAQVVSVGNWNQDGYVSGYNVVSNLGAVDVSWSGYEEPYNGSTAWRLVVWDMSYANPVMVANQTFQASAYETSYQRQIPVTPGNVMRVELYATSGQSPNNWPVSRNIATSMWVAPATNSVSNWNTAPAWNPTPSIVTPSWNSNWVAPGWNPIAYRVSPGLQIVP
jgi:hypothetical protein